VSNLSELLPAGGGQNNFTFTASGAISNGDVVGLNSDGTVSVGTTFATSFGTDSAFDEEINGQSVAYDPNNQKVVILYRDSSNSSYPTAVVATVGASTVSFGTPTVITSTAIFGQLGLAYDKNAQRFVACYRHQAGGLYAVVASLSGTSTTWGSETTLLSSTSSSFPTVVYDDNAQKVVFSVTDFPANGKSIVGTVSGLSISLGTVVTYAPSSTAQFVSMTYDSTAQKIIIAYQDVNNSFYGTAIVGTVSGTSISFGTAVVFNSGNSGYLSSAYDANADKTVITYGKQFGNTYAIVATVSGTSISYGTEQLLDSASSYTQSDTVYDSNAQKVLISYPISGDTKAKVGTISGTSITLESAISYPGNSQVGLSNQSGVFDTNVNRIFIAYRDTANSGYGTGVTFQIGNISEAFIGLAGQAISDTASGTINVIGSLNASQSGLTIGADYYVQADGTLSTTVSDTKVGKAISATQINMKNRS
jgi:hypothetical protein